MLPSVVYFLTMASLGVQALPTGHTYLSKNHIVQRSVLGDTPKGTLSFDLTKNDVELNKKLIQGQLLGNFPEDGKTSTIISNIANQVTHYTIKIGIGRSNNAYPMLVDTGSSDFWVSNDTSLVDVPFDYSADNTRQALQGAFHIDYVRGSADGYWTSNRIYVGHQLENVSYAIVYRGVNSPKIRGSSGILGLSYSHNGKKNLPERLKQEGYINKNAFSLSLTEYKESSGSLLFGGVDHSRYVGDLMTVPRVDSPNTGFKTLSVALSSISVDGNTINTSGSVTPLDSGTTFTYMPPDIYNQIADAFGVVSSSSTAFGAPAFNVTKYGEKEVTFEFSGAKIKVKGKDMALEFKDFHRPDHGDMKIFGIWSNVYSGGYTILGDTFLKSAYVVYDLDGETISLAQANRAPGVPIIETIYNDIPRAKRAPGWV